MLEPFFRLIINVPVRQKDIGSFADIESAEEVRAVLDVLRRFDFAGRVGTYHDVAEIASGQETFRPSDASAPAYGTAGVPAVVPSARLVTYIPAGASGHDLEQLLLRIAAAHPWEHPVIEVDQISLWMPP